MINLIYGGKGSGKTAAIVALANENSKTAKGFHIYIDKSKSRMHDLNHEVKLVDAKEYTINDAKEFIAFVKGMVAVNYDIEKIYIDNLCKIVTAELTELESIYVGLEEISALTGVDFVVTANAEKDELPGFLRKYI